MNWLKRVRGSAGFSLIELLVVLAVGMILALLSYPELAKYYTRMQLEGTTQQLALVMQKARYQAIKTSQQTTVCADTANRRILPSVTTLLPQVELPKAVSFGAPGAQLPITVTANCFRFNSDGSASEAGSFRLVDNHGNYLEVRVDPQATARVQVRKWNETDNQWYVRGEGGKAWEWKTSTIF